MDDPIGRIAILLICLVIIYFVTHKVMSWLRDFFGQGAPFAKRLFIIGGVVMIYYALKYPNDTKEKMEWAWDAIQVFFQNNF